MKFDVVVGNPPYQNGNSESGNFTLWPNFIKKSYEVIADGGILGMVVPQTWAANRKNPVDRAQTTARIRKDVLSRGYLSRVNFDIKSHFKQVGSTFSYFIWHNTSKKEETLVVTENGNYTVEYDSVSWLKIKLETIDAIQKPTLKLINGGKETPGFRQGSQNIGSGKFKIANTSAQYSKEDYLISQVEHPHQRTKKVIFSDSGYSKPFYDGGQLGLGHHARAFEVSSEDEAAAIIEYLNSDYILELSSTIPDSGSMSPLGKLISVGFFDK